MQRFRNFSRSSHFAWQGGDLDFGHLREGLEGWPRPADSWPERHNHFEKEDHIPDSDPSEAELAHHAAHRETYTDTHTNYHFNYKKNSTPTNKRLRLLHNHNDKGHILVPHWSLETYQHLDHIAGHTNREPLTMYRGFGSGMDLKNMDPGTRFTDHGYTGCSFNKLTAHLFAHKHYGGPLAQHAVVAKIHVPAGTKGHYLDNPKVPLIGLASPDEKEYILHRGTEFQVLKHTVHHHETNDNAGPMTHKFHMIHLQVTGQNPKPIHRDPDFDD